MYKFSVAIPTFNSSEFIKECILGFKNSKYIDEIIIMDDCSKVGEIEKIKKIINETDQSFNFTIKLHINKNNLGAFVNKYNLISEAKNEWIYQIDSDNVPFSNIDKIIENVIKENAPEEYLYFPSKIIQFRKYKYIAKLLSPFNPKYRVVFTKTSKVFDSQLCKLAVLENISYENSKKNNPQKKYNEINSKFVKEKHIFWVLNIGNFIVNKKVFLEVMSSGLAFERRLLSMDALVFSYLWLKSNKSIKLANNFGHYHRKRYDSVSFTEKENSAISREYFTKKLLNLTDS